MRKIAAAFALVAAMLLSPARLGAQSAIIDDVAAQEKASYDHCAKALFGPNFIRNVDFNNDRLVDVIVSHGEVVCDGRKGPACRDVGCPYNFYIRVVEGGYFFAASADLYGYDMTKRYGNMVLVLKADGVSCDKEAGEPCTMLIRVRGTRFETITKK